MGLHSYKGIKHNIKGSKLSHHSLKPGNENKLYVINDSIAKGQKRKSVNAFKVSEIDTLNFSSASFPENKKPKKIHDSSSLVSSNSDSGLENLPKKVKKPKSRQKKGQKLKQNIDSHMCCIDYLKKWKDDRTNWKFEKVKQNRLISLAFDKKKLPEDIFPVLIEYMQGGSENIKKLLLAKATEIITEMEAWEELMEEKKKESPQPDQDNYERARSIIQIFE